MELTLYILGQLGVVVFAISGCLAAGRKGLDWIGVLALAFATALGGGTIRDLLLDRPQIFWIADTSYLWLILGTAIVCMLWTQYFKPPNKSLRIADAFGLALFTILGAQIAEAQGVAPIIVVLMGVCTGAAGGVIRDVLSGETPILFRSAEPLYSVAALLGASAYLLLKWLAVPDLAAAICGMLAIAVIRLLAIARNITLPEYHVRE